jgi:hypothetical protein
MTLAAAFRAGVFGAGVLLGAEFSGKIFGWAYLLFGF